MKISYNWLKDYVKVNIEPEKVAEILTSIGLEVEGIEKYEEIDGGLKGFVVGEVLTCRKHPNADKLSLTTVNIGSEKILSIVCGAPNVNAGQKVIVATIGTKILTGEKPFTIAETKIRGEKSEGMICAEDEIGLGTGHAGIMVLDPTTIPGTPASDYFKLTNDTVFEIGLTPNRIDAGSHLGVARDLAASLSMNGTVELNKPNLSSFKTDNNKLPIEVKIEDPIGCRRFTGLTISDIKVSESPKWLKDRLKAIGLSPINNVVDITNYVLHELGQPLHAYDADKLHDNKIIVKRLAEGTKFVTLDLTERSLSKDDVMVCDGKVPVCIAGVFGGVDSGISNATQRIFLESAYFDPKSVRVTARRHGLNTDASFRFERGVDPENTVFALKRAAMMIKEIAGGTISSEISDIYPSPILPLTIEVAFGNIDRLIGKVLDRALIKKIMLSLDITVINENEGKLTVKLPPYRVDVTREADVIEEILRIYGYNQVDFSEKLNTSISYSNKPDNEKLVDLVSNYLVDSGFYEIMSNSLTKKEYYGDLNLYPADRLVPILNPLSADLNVLRQTLLFGGLEAINRNSNHKNPDLRLFEYGRIYSLKDKDKSKFENFREISVFGLFITGKKEDQSWANQEKNSTFFQLKAYYSNILQKINVDFDKFKILPLTNHKDIFKDGLEYFLNNESVIRAGVVNSKLCTSFDIENEVFFAEINWDILFSNTGQKKTFTELPKFPEVRRDLALLLDEEIEYAQIEKLAYESELELLRRVNLFDYYKGSNLPAGKKSYAVSFFLQDLNKTLTDKEIDRIMKKITDNLTNKLKAELR
jgi:phenylalanyl-tRNA synthetase beta chain